MGLEVVDRSPVCDEPKGITFEDDPSDKSLTEISDDEAAARRGETAEELVSDRRDIVFMDRREARSTTRVRDRDPAADELAPQAGSYLMYPGDLGESGRDLLSHAQEHPRRC
ncbi:hypothetical protein [Streptomyces sp. NPDC052015]|uniref:hypothetical protein n=1 Tax=Streptomyces sp. NPDC052015 TaxID=3154755 RepID=UPI003448DE1B